eukprot:TRINITY_DN49260_c0_g1_i1.p2 TRINITY_DN49260_c0_g1~~TRINITY_DN49260_c0_g1_i1.p2  ORF type:complete len:139 (-),score=28.56 TRINITY_DN49260_c0_g1_i1:23-439(-)
MRAANVVEAIRALSGVKKQAAFFTALNVQGASDQKDGDKWQDAFLEQAREIARGLGQQDGLLPIVRVGTKGRNDAADLRQAVQDTLQKVIDSSLAIVNDITGTRSAGSTVSAGAQMSREIGRAVQQECRDRSRMPSSA